MRKIGHGERQPQQQHGAKFDDGCANQQCWHPEQKAGETRIGQQCAVAIHSPPVTKIVHCKRCQQSQKNQQTYQTGFQYQMSEAAVYEIKFTEVVVKNIFITVVGSPATQTK